MLSPCGLLKAVSVTVVVLLSGCQGSGSGVAAGVDKSPPALPGLQAHFFDVGQGDATLFQSGDCTLLVDAGRHDRDDVTGLLAAAGVESLDLLVGTHPHADHIGQFPQILAQFPVSEVWLSGWEHDTRNFEQSEGAILASDALYRHPRAGERFDCQSALTVEVLNPMDPLQDLHDGIALRIHHGDVRFLFTGDAETEHEEQMIALWHDLEAEILQLGHHGSRTSSSEPFLQAVSPDLAIVSAGADNPFGHPHQEVTDRLDALAINTLSTSEQGTITVFSDGSSYRVETAQISAPDEECVDLNRAPSDSLTAIIHISEARASEVIQLREEAWFEAVEDITRVDGIGPSRRDDILAQGMACVTSPS